ncbi:unnamed protein product [Sphacelaria rigidula]
MVWSLMSIAVMSIAFGVSESFAMAVSTRFTLGLLNGVMSTARALVPEIVGQERVVTAMSFFSGAMAAGMTLGPALGGIFAQPAEHFPSIFSSTGIFARYPYLLPNVIGAGLALVSIILVIFYIPETRGLRGGSERCSEPFHPSTTLSGCPSRKSKVPGACRAGHARCFGSSLHKNVGKIRVSGVFGKEGLTEIPNMRLILLMTVIFSMVQIGFSEAYPLWALSSLEVGGLGWSTLQIGTALAISGIGVFVYQFLVYPYLMEKIGIVKLQHGAGISTSLLYLAMPNVKFLSWNYPSLLVVSFVLLASIECTNSAMDVGIMLASTNPVPPRLRGKLSGLILMAESVGRTVGPAGWAIMFAWSVSASGKNSPVGGFRFVFTVSAILMGVVAVMGWKALTEESMTHVVEDSPSPPSSSSSSFPGKKGHSPDGGFELMEAVVIEGRRRDYT